MSDPLRIAVADDEQDMRDLFRRVLQRQGHEIVVAAENGRQLVDGCRQENPHLVITDINMPEMNGLEAVHEICRERPLPIILVSAHYDPELLDRDRWMNVLAFLVKPIKMADLKPAITLAMLRFNEFQALRKEADDLRQALGCRKLVERAKGILMKRTGLDEPSAFRRLQEMSNARNQEMADLARSIVDAEEAFLM